MLKINGIQRKRYCGKYLTNKRKCAKMNNCVETSLQPHRKGCKTVMYLDGESEIKGGKI